MAKSVHLPNGRQWRTRSEALAHFKQMLALYSNGELVSKPRDHDDLSALLAHYDDALKPGEPTKTGAGISHFSREQNTGEGWSTDGFHVHRTDGTSIDFRYINAVRS